MDYSVIDVETTGLTPWTERILEIAVLTLTPDGETTGTWSTLVNPGRPVGATFIHGITDDSVADAPTFSEALPSLVDRLAGTIIVGHNVSFDLEFLNAEFKRSLYPVGIPRSAAVCTMDQSRIYLPPGRHSLAACVDRAGITISPTHRAIDDARCSAALLAHYLQAETAGRRCADEARDRDGRVVLPAEWKRAAGAARSLDWLEVADLSSL
ncbi:3'-5' exonuclease [Flaviflexus sp. JY899]|uniref:3'-5' exonuclease n=1 Tax=Flaviflexus equikiangi TaxID=2758573 RepID=A0ABS2TF46_9ACTO|nr:3'-5' exonuclease [Flaviflexus equikiangi]